MKDRIRKPIAAELLTVRYVPSVLSHAVRIFLVVSICVVCVLSASPVAAAPVIQLITPQSGPVGTVVAIVGSGFGASQGTSTVMFNGTPVTWVSWSATSLQVQVPAGATSGNVVVTVSGKTSNTKSFTVTPPPIISSLSPTSGPVGATVVITGSNFTAGGTQLPQVVFNPELLASPISSTDTSITVAVPAGASTGDLLVSVGGGNSNSVLFTVTSLDPSISSLSPSAGVIGTAVAIKGTNFGSSQGTSTVTFNGTTGIPTSWNATSINVAVPTGATTGNVLVTVGGVSSNPYGFEVGTAAPNITSISPTSGAVATSVTIKGTGFGSTQGTNTVSFNGVSGVPTSWSATQVKVAVPASATTGSVVVTASGTVSNAVSFSVPGTGPSITGLSPSSGPVGALVTITGTNFGATQGGSAVTFNGIAVTAAGWSPTSIVATVPSGATSGNLVVTVSGTASNGLNFTVVPNITSLSPTSGAGGTSVTINGNSFGSSQGTSTVTFNGTAATPTTWGTSSIIVPVPAGAATGSVVVTVGGVASNGFSFSVVTLTSLSITPQNSTIPPGNAQQFSAAGTYSDNSTQNLTATVMWTSSATGIATINNAGLATAVGSGQTTIQASVGSVQASTSLTVSGFALTGSLITGRNGQSATLLNSGMVLIAGGYGINGALATAELYNPITGSFTATGSLNTARTNDTATLLDNGAVLIAGGFDSNGNLLGSAEIYNPATGVFTLTAGSLGTARANHTATLLGNGTVLIAGSADSSGNVSASAEIYNAATQTFTSTGSLITARGLHTAALLNDGTVLILGGGANGTVLASAELYSVVSGTFTATGSLNTGRGQNTATLLNSGSVLVAGGSDVNDNALASAELYNPTTMTFTPTGSLTTARGDHAATLLNNGMVLVEGGYTSSADMTASAELYDPVSGTFSPTGSLNVARQVQTATLLSNGFVLVAGGFSDNSFALTSAELYQPATLVPANLVSIILSPLNPSIPSGTAQNFTATGTFSDNSTQNLASASWTSSNTAIATIASDSSNRGVVFGAAIGSATVNACTGSICGSTGLTVVPPNPSIANLSASSGLVGSTLTITGSGFGAIEGTSTVTFGVVSAPVTGWSKTQIVVTVPGSLAAGVYDIYVNVGLFSSSGNLFQVVTNAPAISALNPSAAAVGTPITITGTNFGASQGTSTITFNSTVAVPTIWSASSIVVPVPNGATSGPIVITANGSQASVNFQVLSVYLASISPLVAGVGSTVTLVGAGFGASQGNGTTTIGGSPLFIFTWSDTQIIAVIPPNTTSGLVQVSQGGAGSNSLNFIVASPGLTSVTPTTGAPGTQVTFSGSGFGASRGSGNVLLGTTFGGIVSWSDTQIVATVLTGSSSGTAQVLQGGVASSSVPFTVSGFGPTISSVSPSSALAGTQVTVTGSGFGASQGSGKILLGTTFGSVASWSDGQIVATVAPGSFSGNVQMFQGPVTSNAVSFIVITPTISSVSPTNGPIGTQVTISGSGFGAAQGNGNAWLGNAYASILSWSDTQVVATVAPGSAAGSAQILQNGVWSNSIPFGTGAPNITSASPTAGTVGTQIAIGGSGFGSSAGTLQLGTLPGLISSWSDSQIVATVASGSLTGIVRVQQNGLTSNSLRFIVPTSGTGNAVTLTPSLLNLLVGQTQTIQALSPTGTEVTGLSWTTSDSTVVSLSTDDPPILTAVASGHVTITAGDSSCDVTVFSGSALPLGTVIWSAPGDGSGVTSIIPAVPSPTGVADTFAVQASGNVQAITSDGSVAWTANVGNGYNTLNADFQGGLVAVSPYTITKYDGITGQQTSQYTYNNPRAFPPVYFGTDGTIFTIDGASVVGIDPATGAPKFTVQMQSGADSSVHTCEYQQSGSGTSPPSVGVSTLAGDGYLYVSYQYSSSAYQDAPMCGGNAGYTTTTQALVRVGPSGDSTSFTIGTSTSSAQVVYYNSPDSQYSVDSQSQSGNPLQITSMITNADQGIFATWSGGGTNAYCPEEIYYYYPASGPGTTICVPATPGQTGVMTIGSSGITSQTTSADGYGPVLQDANGIFYGSTGEGSLSAFDQTGNVKWSVPGYSPLMLTADGNVLAQSPSGTYVGFDQSGVATSQTAISPVVSWTGNDYKNDGSADLVAFSPVEPSGSFAAFLAGNPSQNGTDTAMITFQKRVIYDGTQGQNFMDVPLDGIANSQTGSVLVTIGAGSGPLKLALSSTGTGKATFGDGSTSMNLPGGTQPEVLQITGAATSNKADDISLTATRPTGSTYGSTKFSVVSVSIALNTNQVSPSDQGNSAFATATAQQLSSLPNHLAKLGPLTIPYLPVNPNFGCSMGAEFIGTVTPADYKGKITLRRDLLARTVYNWNDSNTPPSGTSNLQPVSSSGLMDDTSLPEYITKLLQIAKSGQNGPDVATIYDLDGPGPRPHALLFSTAISYRGNFREYAELGDWSRDDPMSSPAQVSPDFFWFARATCDTSSGTTFEFDDSYPGDNAVGGAVGPTRTKSVNCTPTSVDLSGSCSP